VYVLNNEVNIEIDILRLLMQCNEIDECLEIDAMY
jgi:hypothetical protein